MFFYVKNWDEAIKKVKKRGGPYPKNYKKIKNLTFQDSQNVANFV